MNHFKKCKVILISTALFLSCKVTDKKISGIFVDSQKGDTLTIFSNKRFEFQEKLSYGDFGWNTGSWAMNKNGIIFFNVKPDPVVGYRLKKNIKDSSAKALKITLLLNASKKLINIKDVSVFLGRTILDTSSFNYNLNTLSINTNAFDSFSVATSYFPPFPFKKKDFEKNKRYEILIYPAERLFELDKHIFEYKRKSLLFRPQKIRLKKISNGHQQPV